ncbi:MAG: signal peptidase I [Atopobiaceae bacterium]|nr:signal peptidase I [Atopobiaceae bacterium]
MFGIFLIVLVLAMVLPVTLPRLMGYEVFNIISGSMEPAIPMGSAIYVSPIEPKDVQVDDVIAFLDEGSVVAHRVVTNRTSLGEFVTKGDANNTEDLFPVPYDSLIGVVALSVPMAGAAMSLYASPVGKVYLFMTLACGIMLNILADRMRTRRSRQLREKVQEGLIGADASSAGDPAAAADAPRRSGGWIRTVVMCALALVFFGSGGVVLYVQHQHAVSADAFQSLIDRFVSAVDDKGGTVAPIKIDFDALKAENPDIEGWLYCPNSRINYPVMRGANDDTYLHHNFKREYDFAGCLFVDSASQPDFADASTIIYGHHMLDDSMFGTLDDWSNQAFYEEHPVMWLLTPTQDYQVVLVSGHTTSAHSDLYEVHRDHDDAFAQFLATVAEQSDFTPVEGAEINPERNYVMLSTCSFVFDDARYVIHGKLVPVDSVGGEPAASLPR